MVCWKNYSIDPADDPDLVLSDPVAEAERQAVIREAKEHQMEGYTLFTEDERKIVYQREYEKADKIPDYIVIVFIIFLASLPIFAVCPRNPISLLIAIICCGILIITGNYALIVLGLLLNCIIFPTLFVMGVFSLFQN